jgi:virginiamycin B lyase
MLVALLPQQGAASTIQMFPLPWDPFKAPYGLAIDTNGIVWFTEQSGGILGNTKGNKIGRLDPVAGVYTEWQIPSPNAFPQDLTLDSGGRIWFTEYGANQVGRLDPSTNQITEFLVPTANSAPFGIQWDNTNGVLWFVESAGNKITKFDPTTSSFTEYPIPTTNSNTQYLAIDPTGTIWFAETNSAGVIGSLNPATGAFNEFRTPTPTGVPVGITYASNLVWFTMYGANKIASFKPATGTFTEYPIPTPNTNPWSLIVDSSGIVWFTEVQATSGSGGIGRLDPTIASFTEYTLPPPMPPPGTQQNHPRGIALDPSGNVWAALWDTDYLARLTFAPATIAGATASGTFSTGPYVFSSLHSETSNTLSRTGATTLAVTSRSTVNQGFSVTAFTTAETVLSKVNMVTFLSSPPSFPGSSLAGSISSCGGTFTNGQSANCGGSFSATANLPSPSAGWQFSNWIWSGGVSCNSNTANPTACTASSSGSLKAVYLAQVTFSIIPSSAGSISWDSCSNPGYGNGQTLQSSSFGAHAICYAPSGYTFSSWTCTGGLACSGSSNPTVATFTGPGTITLNLKTGSLSNPVSTSLTASASPANPVHGISLTVSGTLTANGGGLGGEQIVLVFGWSSSIVAVTTQPGGLFSYVATAPASAGSYKIQAFFLGDLGGSTQYLPGTATAAITVT